MNQIIYKLSWKIIIFNYDIRNIEKWACECVYFTRKKNMDQTLWANEEQPQSVYHDAFKITWL